MDKRSLSFLLLSFLSLPGGTSGYSDYTDCFLELNQDFGWSAPKSDRSHTVGAFGPRKNYCTKLNDFHRGILIEGDEGDEIKAVYDGVVHKIGDLHSTGEANYVVLEHDFKDAKTCDFQGNDVTKWYSYYMHLSKVDVKVGDSVETGKKVGEMGYGHCEHDITLHPTLELEVRVGTPCSLAWAIDNPGSSCNTLGEDPHVNPQLVFPMGSSWSSASFKTEAPLAPKVNAEINIRIPRGQESLDKYEIDCMGKQFTLGLNDRINFDATSKATLDFPPEDVPHLKGWQYHHDDTHWQVELVIPYVWFESSSADDKCDVVVSDIWGIESGRHVVTSL